MAELAEPFGISQLFSLCLPGALRPQEGKGFLVLHHIGSWGEGWDSSPVLLTPGPGFPPVCVELSLTMAVLIALSLNNITQ